MWKKNATHLITIFGPLTTNVKNNSTIPESAYQCDVKLHHEPLNYAVIWFHRSSTHSDGTSFLLQCRKD